MEATLSPRKIAVNFVLAGAIACLGFHLSMRLPGEAGTTLIRVAYLAAALVVLRFTFGWGRVRGFPAYRADGGLALDHILRNLVMAAILCGLLLLVCAPFMLLLSALAR